MPERSVEEVSRKLPVRPVSPQRERKPKPSLESPARRPAVPSRQPNKRIDDRA